MGNPRNRFIFFSSSPSLCSSFVSFLSLAALVSLAFSSSFLETCRALQFSSSSSLSSSSPYVGTSAVGSSSSFHPPPPPVGFVPSSLSNSFFSSSACLSSSSPYERRALGRGRIEEDDFLCTTKKTGGGGGQETSKLHSNALLSAVPKKSGLSSSSPSSDGGVKIEGEFVDGKSVREWKVERSLYQALHMALAEEMKRDKSVCIMGEDVGHYGGSYKVSKDLHALYGNFRSMDTPICENTFTGMAVGAAMNGIRPVVEGMNMGFLLLAFNQIANNAGMVRYTSGGAFDVPVVIRGPGGIGKQLGPEHSQRIEAYLMAIPGLKIVACSTPYNARGLLKSAIREDNPVVFFEHVLTYNIKQEIPLLPYTLPLDKAEMAREGKDLTVLCYGKLRHVALEAAQQLAKLGVDAEVLDLISLKPLDMDSIKKSLKKTGRCLILDESSRTGGIGGEVFTQVMENCADELLDVPVRLASKDIPTPYAQKLEEATIVHPIDVVNTSLWLLTKRGQAHTPQQ